MFTYFSFSTTSHNPNSTNYHCKTPSCHIGTQFINTQDILKDYSNHEAEKFPKAPFNQKLLSPDLRRKRPSRSEKPENIRKYLTYTRKRKNRSSVPPHLKLAEIKPDFPRNEGMNLVVHQYALPQGLTAIKTPSPVNKAKNILEESIVPTAHPIVRKGMSGWKISLRKLWKVDRRRKTLASGY